MVLKGQSSQQRSIDLQTSYFLQLLNANLGMKHAIISISTIKPAKKYVRFHVVSQAAQVKSVHFKLMLLIKICLVFDFTSQENNFQEESLSSGKGALNIC